MQTIGDKISGTSCAASLSPYDSLQYFCWPFWAGLPRLAIITVNLTTQTCTTESIGFRSLKNASCRTNINERSISKKKKCSQYDAYYKDIHCSISKHRNSVQRRYVTISSVQRRSVGQTGLWSTSIISRVRWSILCKALSDISADPDSSISWVDPCWVVHWNDTICRGLKTPPHLDLSRGLCAYRRGCYGN